ncbi:MAG TPA: hypothetical protein VFW25_09105 [Silvibacterium sp.]|nr:hypothetical protein [Silvibacterium sp.]
MVSGGLEFPEIADVYTRYAALTALSADLGGLLLLYSGLDRAGIALAIASNVAGSASLGIESEAARAKSALRAGVCDFVVNNLDEALRILKNEIRKRRAVSVVLTGGVSEVVAEMVERGVQPEVLAFSVPELMERGALLLAKDAGSELVPVRWSVAAEPLRWLPALDAMAAAAIEKSTPGADARVRWLEASPRYLGRAFAGQRFLRMTDAEADAFVVAVRAAVGAGAVAVAVSIQRGQDAISIKP